jgi:hypothetical protein
MKKSVEPSRASLREMPEIDFAKVRTLARGKYAEKARRSFAVALIDPAVFAHFGSSEAVNAALRALIDASKTVRAVPRAARGTRSRSA